MILQELNRYAARLSKDGKLAPPGFTPEKISFCVVLSPTGELLQIQDIRQGDKKKSAQLLDVPQGIKKSSGIASQFCWENVQYIFGIDTKGKPERALGCFEAFKTLHLGAGQSCKSPVLIALNAFLDQWQPPTNNQELPPLFPDYKEIETANFVFRLDGQTSYLHDDLEVQKASIQIITERENEDKGQCLVTGQQTKVARLHPSIKGVPGAQSSGASLVSFNQASFVSYNKEQSLNSPVSSTIAVNYGKALNYLLDRNHHQKVSIGSVTHVFWGEEPNPMEQGLMGLLSIEKKDSEAHTTNQELHALLQALKKGRLPTTIDPNKKFFILSLSPNAARLSVCNWLISTVGQLFHQAQQHFQDLKIHRPFESQAEFPSLAALLLETASLRKFENISPHLNVALTRSFLNGDPYPVSLLSAIIGRIKADHSINYLRAALIKAYLVRKARLSNQPTEATVSLNEESTDPGYRLGRLFSVLEKAQADALGKTNSTITTRYYGAASANPGVVFPLLMRGAQHHLQKAKYGGLLDRLIQEVTDGLDQFPAQLPLEQQGLFALGYYHQKQALYTKKPKTGEENVTES